MKNEHIISIIIRIDQTLSTISQQIDDLTNFFEQDGPVSEKQPCPCTQTLEPYLDKQEVMKYLRIRETTYYRWVQEGKLQPRGPGDDKFFLRDIHELMERRKYRHRG